MRVILSGGGTGGHIYPALSIAEELKSRDPAIEILYVGKENSLEEELVQRVNIPFKTVRVKPMPRKGININFFSSVIELVKGLEDAKKILLNFKPDFVIGTGGYVCAPILLKAQQLKIPTLVQEQNAYPGKTNRLLSRKANLVALSFEEAKQYFQDNTKTVFTGNPIRKDFLTINQEQARDVLKDLLPLDYREQMVLSFGGSGGQESTNEAILELIKLAPDPEFQLIHVTGKAHYEKFMESLPDEYNDKAYIFLDYTHYIPELMTLADIVIASSSAMTLAEISAVGVPSILIPKAYTAGNHQFYNAKSYESNGASIAIEEKNLNGKILLTNLYEILRDPDLSDRMSKESKKLGNPRAVEKIVDEIERILSNEA